jgi:hypothetical protein
VKRKLTTEELAEAWKAGALPLHTAVRRHWKIVGLWPVKEEVILALALVVGFANLEAWDTRVPVGNGEEMSIREIVDRFQLAEFLG